MRESDYDYVIVGAGSAGCVLASRLSEDPANRVCLLEAGGRDTNPMIRVPRGFGKLLSDPSAAWFYPTLPFGKTQRVETWVRGKTLGGSSAVNGMVYNRGAAADWDALGKLAPAFAWPEIVRAYKSIEDNPLGETATRGVGGPLKISCAENPSEICDEMIAAGAGIGLAAVADLNESDDERIGYAMATIRKGRRQSSADAFLHPAAQRPNLTIAVNSPATRILFEGERAVGVRVGSGASASDLRAQREVILATGSLATPALLQRSGIGRADLLRRAGIEVRVDQASVGAHLREHHCFLLQFRLNAPLGYNRKLSHPVAQILSGIQYYTTRRGALAAPSFDVIGFLKSRPGLERPDAQILMAPWTQQLGGGKAIGLYSEPGLQCIGYVLRPDSEGSVSITSSDPEAELAIDANYYATPHDREIGLALFGKMRALFAQAPIAQHLERELFPGLEAQSDEQILAACDAFGPCGYHAIGTCALGPRESDVVDAELRVRGAAGLRIVDCSILPQMIAGNLNGPIMALAWRAAELILNER
jgi:choline dehydrogenase-like flavoprotein